MEPKEAKSNQGGIETEDGRCEISITVEAKSNQGGIETHGGSGAWSRAGVGKIEPRWD